MFSWRALSQGRAPTTVKYKLLLSTSVALSAVGCRRFSAYDQTNAAAAAADGENDDAANKSRGEGSNLSV